ASGHAGLVAHESKQAAHEPWIVERVGGLGAGSERYGVALHLAIVERDAQYVERRAVQIDRVLHVDAGDAPPLAAEPSLLGQPGGERLRWRWLRCHSAPAPAHAARAGTSRTRGARGSGSTDGRRSRGTACDRGARWARRRAAA